MALSRIRVLAADYQQGKRVPCEPNFYWMVSNTELVDLLRLNGRLAIWEKIEEFHNDTDSLSYLQINYL